MFSYIHFFRKQFKFGLLAYLLILYSCQSSGGNAKKLKMELDSIKNEIATIKQTNFKDSINNDAEWRNIRDSLQIISDLNNQDLSVLYEELKSSIFLVYTSDGYNISQGSAFLINSDGTCVSNYHVFNGMNKGVVKNYREEQFPINRIITYDKEKDFIIFRISIGSQYISPLKISNELPKVGDECFAIGNPKGLAQTLSTGIVSGIRDYGNLIQTTAEITHGSSGGALFNKKGEVIGITSSGLGEADLNFAINIQSINFASFSSDRQIYSSEAFIVTNERAYFHNDATYESSRSAYMVLGERGAIIKKQNGFAYVIFTNSRQQTSRGWIDIDDISSSANTSEQKATTKTMYKVEVSKAFFYSSPNLSSRKSAYFVYGETFYSTQTQNGFVYTVFTNAWGRTTDGWIRSQDISEQ